MITTAIILVGISITTLILALATVGLANKYVKIFSATSIIISMVSCITAIIIGVVNIIIRLNNET